MSQVTLPPQRPRHRFTVDEYESMIKLGILTENDRVELIRGEIVEKMPIGDEHAAAVKRLNRYLNHVLGDRGIIGVQDPVRLTDSEPEPDISVAVPRDDLYASGKPRPADLFLVIEVADSSLDYDRTTKLSMYAEAGVREYWIINLPDGCLEVHRNPRADGSYGARQILRRGQTVEVEALLGTSFDVGDLLPPAP